MPEPAKIPAAWKTRSLPASHKAISKAHRLSCKLRAM